jgi:hypothetical protein
VSVHKQRREKSKENEKEQQRVYGSAACKKNGHNLMTNDLNTLQGKFGDGRRRQTDRQTDRLSLLFKEAAVCKRLCLKEKKDFASLM